MNDMFSNLFDVCVVVYLNNILIYSDDITQYWNYIKEVLKQLRKSELYAKTEKCEFHSDSVEYLGYVVRRLTSSERKVSSDLVVEGVRIYLYFCVVSLLLLIIT